MKKRDLVSSHFLLEHLAPEELDTLLAYATTERYQTHQAIFHKGDPGNSLMMVVEGRIKISASSAEGKEMVLAVLGKGEILGEMAILEGKPRSADAMALEPTEVLVLQRREFIPFLERNPKICVRLLSVLSARLRRTSELAEDRVFLSLPSRLAKMLLDLAGADAEDLENGVRIDFRMSQKDLAALLGASRESVNKQLSAWQHDGLIKMGRGYVVLQRPQDMVQIAEHEL